MLAQICDFAHAKTSDCTSSACWRTYNPDKIGGPPKQYKKVWQITLSNIRRFCYANSRLFPYRCFRRDKSNSRVSTRLLNAQTSKKGEITDVVWLFLTAVCLAFRVHGFHTFLLSTRSGMIEFLCRLHTRITGIESIRGYGQGAKEPLCFLRNTLACLNVGQFYCQTAIVSWPWTAKLATDCYTQRYVWKLLFIGVIQ